jgi:hypothetical protein
MIEHDPIIVFWSAPNQALFPSAVIAKVRNVSVALLERERWQNTGPKYLKLGGRVLYRKSDVLEWIGLHEKESALVITALNTRAREDADADAPIKDLTGKISPAKRHGHHPRKAPKQRSEAEASA